jgi:hypothetical protein
MTTSNMSFKKLVQLVSTSPRPLVLHFLHAVVDITTHPLQAAAEAAASPAARTSFSSEMSEDVGDQFEESQFHNVNV